MFGSIRGTVLRIDGFTALIEVAGIGYEVEVLTSALAKLKVGSTAFLYLHHAVREDAHLLYGFLAYDERLLFRELLKVSGIGAKTALALVSTLSYADLTQAVESEDVRLISTVPGIGRKTAERLIVELKDRLKRLPISISMVPTPPETKTETLVVPASEGLSPEPSLSPRVVREESIAALIGLGYKENAAVSYVKAVYQSGMDTRAVIVAALAHIAQHHRRG